MPSAARSCSSCACIFIALHGAVPDPVDLQHLDRPTRTISRPDGLNLIPPGASPGCVREGAHAADEQPRSASSDLARQQPQDRPVSSAIAVLIGVTAAYAFSRLRFRGREALMIAILGVLMLPSVATHRPALRLPQPVPDRFGGLWFNLRASLVGVSLAVISAQLPFAIWNLKGYLDTIPKDLEEAAASTAPSQNQSSPRSSCRSRLPRSPSRASWASSAAGPSTSSRTCSSAATRRTGRWRSRSTAWSASSPGRRPGPSSARSRSCSRCRSRWSSSSSSATSSAGSQSAASRARSATRGSSTEGSGPWDSARVQADQRWRHGRVCRRGWNRRTGLRVGHPDRHDG